MGYYTRILGVNENKISISQIEEELRRVGLNARFESNHGNTQDNWSRISVYNSSNELIMGIERNPILEGNIGKEELDEFRDEVVQDKPESAAKWLYQYFEKVKVIIAFKLKHDVSEGENNEIVDFIKSFIWEQVGGVLQSDEEGFTNEDGSHILWQFNYKAQGEWKMAVLNSEGEWIKFIMNMDDESQYKAFLEGHVPDNAAVIKN